MLRRVGKSVLCLGALCALPPLLFFSLGGSRPAGAGMALLLGLTLAGAAHRFGREIAEEEMARLNRRRLEAKTWYFEGILAESANIIFTTDAEHRVMKFNAGSERAFGKSQSEVLGREVQTLFQDADAILGLLREVEAKGRAEMPEALAAGSDQPTWLSLSVTRMRNREGEVIGEVFNGVNITARKRLDDELRNKNDQLLHLSLTDGLTGLYNIRYLHDELTRLCRARRRYPERALAVALLDVDRFKAYNDSLGHPAGDRLLIELAGILKQALRQGMDTAYRLGGDEFLLALPDTREEGARVICDRVLQAYRKAGLGATSLSIGIAADRDAPPPDADVTATVQSLLRRADRAMYQAKEQGGDRAAIALASPPS